MIWIGLSQSQHQPSNQFRSLFILCSADPTTNYETTNPNLSYCHFDKIMKINKELMLVVGIWKADKPDMYL